MKTTTSLLALTLGGMLVLGGTGCHRQSASSSAPPKTLEEGVTQLTTTLAGSSPQVQSNLYNGVLYGIRYSDFTKASLALQQIATDPGLNPEQKKLVNDVGDLLKQAAAKPKTP